MSEAVANKPLTSEDLFAMRPSKKVDRWLFRGELRESRVTKRNPNHSGAVMALGRILGNWAITDPKRFGKVQGAEVYFRIRTDPETNVGIDVALGSPAQTAAITKKSSFIDGPPTFAAEVLSPYDKQKEIDEAIDEYLSCGVPVVWIVNPTYETVTVYRLGAEPVLYNRTQVIDGDPELPGFKCRVAEIFE
jgi:Uma2 family endonuclease